MMRKNKGQTPSNNCDKADSISPHKGCVLARKGVLENPRQTNELARNCPPKADQSLADNRSCPTGQVMLLTVILLSGAILASSSLAGLLILYQLKQATDIKGSMKAIFAADAGIEWAFYNENKLGGSLTYPNPGPKLTNDSKVTVTKIPSDPLPLKAVGQSGRSARAFQANLPPSP